jgi:hypothetical protein
VELSGAARLARTVVAGLALVVAAAGSAVAPMLASSSTGDPSSNIPPDPPFLADCSGSTYDDSSQCVDAVVQAIDNARSQEGVGPMVLPSNWYSLSVAEQFFVATNLERVARGLPALSGMASALDQSASQAASQAQDPTPPSGFPMRSWDSNWAGGGGNPLEIVYFFMYYDGPASTNTACTQAGQPACWVHRNNILADFACQPCVIGTGFSPTGYDNATSYAELLVDATAEPALDFSWSEVEPYLPSDEDGWDPAPGTTFGPSASAAGAGAWSTATSGGHRLVGADGGIFAFGTDAYEGSVPGLGMSVDDVVGMATTPDGRGYWLAGADGGVFAFGDAAFYGSVPGVGDRVDDVVGIASTPDGRGYWLVGGDGGVFSFGDAGYFGSVPGEGYSVSDIVGIVAGPRGQGYWLVGRRGEVWAYGAPWYGSPWSSGIPVTDVVGMAATPDGGGYWLVGRDGGIFSYGDAPYCGSLPAMGVQVDDVVGIASAPDGGGYWLFGADGGTFALGDTSYFGSLPAMGVHVDDVVGGTGR